MRQSTRLIANTAVLLSRMLVTFGIGLLITRLLLERMGAPDYGLLAALGATGTTLMLLSRSLNVGSLRQLAHALGRDDEVLLRRVFNASLVLFLGMGGLVAALGLAVEPLVLGAIQMPPGREGAAFLVYNLTLLGFVVIAIATPFRAVIEAHQQMGVVAAFEVLRTLLNLTAVLLLFAVEGDRLVIYSAALAASVLIRTLAMVLLAMARFPESRPSPAHFHVPELRRIAGFTGWATLIKVGTVLHGQASVLVLATAFPPLATAAYAIAIRVRDYHRNFTKVFPRVAQPAMTTREARGDRAFVQDLALVMGKVTCLGAMFLGMPLLLEAPILLDLWLGSVPPGSADFVRLTVAWLSLLTLGSGFEQAVIAHGRVRFYAVATTALWALSLVMACVCFYVFDTSPLALPLCILAAVMVLLPFQVVYAGRLIGVGSGRWLRETVRPVALAVGPPALLATVVHATLPEGWLRLCWVALAYAGLSAPLCWRYGLGPRERRSVERVARRLLPGSARRRACRPASPGVSS